MSNILKVSLIVITCNRKGLLRNCLFTLFPQLEHKDELIVINTHVNAIEIEYVKNLFIKSIHLPDIGIAKARNAGIQASSCKWSCFLDDDCIPTTNWLNCVKGAISANPNAAAILGPSRGVNNKNIFSAATDLIYDEWQRKSVQETQVISPFFFDTKNVAINKDIFSKKKITFDETLDLGEDCDVGLQINAKNGATIFSPDMIVHHNNPTDFFSFFNRQLSYIYATIVLYNKWQTINLIKNTYKTNQRTNDLHLIKGLYRAKILTLCIKTLDKLIFSLIRIKLLNRLLLVVLKPQVRYYLYR